MADPERFLYFAYGSNMLTRRLRAKDRAPSAQRVGMACVTGYRLSFDKEGKDEEGRQSGKCDIRRTDVPTDRVWGVLFSIDVAESVALDKKEGARGKNPGYERRDVTVVAEDGREHKAATYIALRTVQRLRPYQWYRALVVAGAVEHNLPPAYIEWLRTFESEPDPDAERRAENEALLFEREPDRGNPRG
jgi:gamma-glutamylcyclotransferase